MPGMLRTRSPWKSTFASTRSACIQCPSPPGGKSASPLEIEVATQCEQTLEAVLEDHVDRACAEPPIGLRHPAVGKIAIVRKQNAQRLVDAEQVPGTVEQVAVVGERLAAAIAGERAAAAGGKAERVGLLGGRQVPVLEQRGDHHRDAAACLAAAWLDGDALACDGWHRRPCRIDGTFIVPKKTTPSNPLRYAMRRGRRSMLLRFRAGTAPRDAPRRARGSRRRHPPR